MKIFKGTRNYHNFTIKLAFSSSSAKRYISLSSAELINPQNIVENNRDYNVPFILFQIEGHGFMYHQIRKMIGFIIQIRHKLLTPEEIQKAFEDYKIDILLAPSAGLFLKEVKF